MPPLEEMSVSSGSGSDMDLESVNSESHGPTNTRTLEELTQIERDIFGGSESGSEELYAEPSQPVRVTRSWIMESDMSSELSEDRIVDDWDRILVQEKTNSQIDETSSVHSMDESTDASIIESIAQDAY